MSRVVTAAAACVIAGLLAACNKTAAPTAAAAGAPAAPVTVSQAERKTLPIEVRAIGNVEPYKTISVKSQVTGILKKVNFREGESVTAGQRLFEIDPRPYEEAIRQLESNLARDTALEAQAEANLKRDMAQERFSREQARRYGDLAKQGVFSSEQSEQAATTADAQSAAVAADRAAIESARASMKSDQSALANAKLQLSYCFIDSPVAGRTGNISVKEGNLVKATDVELVTVMQVEPIYVTFTIPENSLDAVRERMRGGGLRVQATPDGNTAKSQDGTLTFIDNTVDQSTGTIKLKGTFANRNLALWPGRFVDVVLSLSQKPNIVAVPARAVQIGQGGSYVFVVKQDQTVEMRNVTTGLAAGDLVEVQGVEPGETVVTSGHVRLAAGTRVKVQS